jgi:hypothetical protein
VLEQQPVQYPQANGQAAYVNVGASLTLNTRSAFPFGSLHVNRQSQGGAAHFVLAPPQRQLVTPGATSNKIYYSVCKHCGRQKMDHPSYRSTFGAKKCIFQHCARYGFHVSYHQGFPMGVLCCSTLSTGAHNLSNYDRQITALRDKENS